MKHKAVIFDLFGTLVNNISTQKYRGKLIEMATILAIDPSTFIKLWFDRSDERMDGVIENYQEDIKYICKKVETPLEDEKIKLVTQIRFDMIRNQMVPRGDALEVLSSLRTRGCKTGLISDCSNETTIIWRNTSFATLFDVTVFSCLMGFTKPDPRIYRYIIEQLGFEPDDCLYIGDGGSHELTGARQVGMHAVLLQIPNEDSTDTYQYNKEEWDGPVVSSLTKVIGLLD